MGQETPALKASADDFDAADQLLWEVICEKAGDCESTREDDSPAPMDGLTPGVVARITGVMLAQADALSALIQTRR